MTNHPSFVHRIRQNHALEHATVHALSHWQPGVRLVGRSDWSGFWLYGDVDTTRVEQAVRHGLAQLVGGHAASAIHPRCGTNTATGMLLASAGGLITARAMRRSRWWGSIWAMLALWGTLKIAQPLGLLMQRHITTTADMSGLQVLDVTCVSQGNLMVHHIITSDQ